MNIDNTNFSGSKNFSYEVDDLIAMRSAFNYYNWILDLFEPYVNNKLLEIGAGTGNLSNIILDRWENRIQHYIALEPDPKLYKNLNTLMKNRNKINIQCEKGFLHDIYPKLQQEDIDTIIYVNVLEHVQNDVEELANAATLLGKGGHLLTFTPAMPCLYSYYDQKLGHYRRYTLAKMEKKMIKTGLKIVKSHYFDFLGSLFWWIKYKLFKNSALEENQVYFYDRYIIPFLKQIEPSSNLPFGKNIIVIGRKE